MVEIRIMLDYLVFVIFDGGLIDSIMHMCYCALYLMFVHNLLWELICDI